MRPNKSNWQNAMTTIEITLDDEKIQDLLGSDQGLAGLLQPALNQLLQAEMTNHLQAEPGERTDQRRDYRNGSYERKLTTRVGTLDLEVPRDRAGTFFYRALQDAISARRRLW